MFAKNNYFKFLFLDEARMSKIKRSFKQGLKHHFQIHNKYLCSKFAVNNYPNNIDYESMSLETNIPVFSLKNWFSQRRSLTKNSRRKKYQTSNYKNSATTTTGSNFNEIKADSLSNDSSSSVSLTSTSSSSESDSDTDQYEDEIMKKSYKLKNKKNVPLNESRGVNIIENDVLFINTSDEEADNDLIEVKCEPEHDSRPTSQNEVYHLSNNCINAQSSSSFEIDQNMDFKKTKENNMSSILNKFSFKKILLNLSVDSSFVNKIEDKKLINKNSFGTGLNIGNKSVNEHDYCLNKNEDDNQNTVNDVISKQETNISNYIDKYIDHMSVEDNQKCIETSEKIVESSEKINSAIELPQNEEIMKIKEETFEYFMDTNNETRMYDMNFDDTIELD